MTKSGYIKSQFTVNDTDLLVWSQPIDQFRSFMTIVNVPNGHEAVLLNGSHTLKSLKAGIYSLTPHFVEGVISETAEASVIFYRTDFLVNQRINMLMPEQKIVQACFDVRVENIQKFMNTANRTCIPVRFIKDRIAGLLHEMLPGIQKQYGNSCLDKGYIQQFNGFAEECLNIVLFKEGLFIRNIRFTAPES